MLSAPKNIFGPNVFRIFLQELGGHKRVAKFLGVSTRTITYWVSRDKPPRAAVLALYWESQYGRSLIESDQVNEIRLLSRRVQLLQEQYAKAREIVSSLRHMQTGTANEAFFVELPDLTFEIPNTYGLSSPLGEPEQKQAKAA